MLVPQAKLVIENLALRQQVAVFRRSVKRPKLRPRDRVFWVWLSRLWLYWQSALVMAQPETVHPVAPPGIQVVLALEIPERETRPPAREIRGLISRMSRENPTWGAPRIVSEVALLGHDVAQQTVAKYMVRKRQPPSQTWRTFLNNHVPDIAACDFFTIPTVTFRVLYVFIVLRHDRRQILHFNVTTNPSAEWTTQQIINSFAYQAAPRFLLRDRDGIYGDHFTNCIGVWASKKSRSRHALPSRIPTANASSVPSAENAWTA